MNQKIFLIAALLNVVFLLAKLIAQHFDRKNGIIPLRHSTIEETGQKFLYAQDFLTQTMGYTIGGILILHVFINLVDNEKISIAKWILFLLLAISLATKNIISYKKTDRRPDWKNPKPGVISKSGVINIFQSSILIPMLIICFLSIFSNDVNILETVIGLSMYIASFIYDGAKDCYGKPMAEEL